MRVYLDTCCYFRYFDDARQVRIRSEAEAVDRILARAESGHVVVVGSDVLRREVARDQAPRRRQVTEELMAQHIAEWHAVNDAVLALVASIRSQGIDEFDALHMAAAIDARVEWLLTVDDRFIARARKSLQGATIRVINPVEFAAGLA